VHRGIGLHEGHGRGRLGPGHLMPGMGGDDGFCKGLAGREQAGGNDEGADHAGLLRRGSGLTMQAVPHGMQITLG
jgi:hypothetical protein